MPGLGIRGITFGLYHMRYRCLFSWRDPISGCILCDIVTRCCGQGKGWSDEDEPSSMVPTFFTLVETTCFDVRAPSADGKGFDAVRICEMAMDGYAIQMHFVQQWEF